MISRINAAFRERFAELPESIRQQARTAFRQFQKDPYHPSLHFRQVHPNRPIYSARINRSYRAVGIRDGDEILWFWIGSHANYDHLLSRL